MARDPMDDCNDARAEMAGGMMGEEGRCVKCGNVVQKEGCPACGGKQYMKDNRVCPIMSREKGDFEPCLKEKCALWVKKENDTDYYDRCSLIK